MLTKFKKYCVKKFQKYFAKNTKNNVSNKLKEILC